MKKCLLIVCLLCYAFSLFAQVNKSTSEKIAALKNQITAAKDDITRFDLYNSLFGEYLFSFPDSALLYAQHEMALAEQMQSDSMIARAYLDFAYFSKIIGDYPRALDFDYKALQLAEKSNHLLSIVEVYNDIAGV